MKKATTLDEQIELYRSRGCELDLQEEEIKNILLDVGYYRLGFYAFPFEKTYPSKEKRSHEYKPGTKFSEIVALYELDFNLRMTLLKYINHMEINFRTKLIYFVSNRYKDNPTWFRSNKIMTPQYIKDFNTEMYDRIKCKQESIKRYGDNEYAPAWKTFDYATFGNVVSTYESLLDKTIKIEIASEYGVIKEKVMINYIKAMKNLRNMVAHGGVLLDYNLEDPLRDGPALKVSNENNCKLYSAILVLQYLLKSISEKLSQDLEKGIKDVFDDLKGNEKLRIIIKTCSGYSQK